jgi:hypothetical protein
MPIHSEAASGCVHSFDFYLQFFDQTPWLEDESFHSLAEVAQEPHCRFDGLDVYCDITYKARWVGAGVTSEWSNVVTVRDVIVVPEATIELGLVFGVALLVYLWGRRNARRGRETSMDRRRRLWRR